MRRWVGGGYQRIRLESVPTRGVNTVPYWPVYTVPARKSVRLTPLFRTGKNTGRTDHVPTVLVNFGQYQPVQKKSFYFYFYYHYFLSFAIFEFLLGQNGNLFALTY